MLIYVKGNGIDDVMLYGRGAGSLPTGSSVVSDIMEVAKNVSYNETGRLKPFYYDQKIFILQVKSNLATTCV